MGFFFLLKGNESTTFILYYKKQQTRTVCLNIEKSKGVKDNEIGEMNFDCCTAQFCVILRRPKKGIRNIAHTAGKIHQNSFRKE
jgi:hypothetical protein